MNSDMTHTLNRQSIVDNVQGGELLRLVRADSPTKIRLVGMSCHVIW